MQVNAQLEGNIACLAWRQQLDAAETMLQLAIACTNFWLMINVIVDLRLSSTISMLLAIANTCVLHAQT